MTVATAHERTDYKLSGWQLSELLPETSASALSERLAELEAAVSRFERHRTCLGDEDAAGKIEPGQLLDVLDEYQQLIGRMTVLDCHASLWFSSDTQSQAALTHQNRVQQALAGATNRVLFFELWWKGLADDEVARLLPAGDEHTDHRHYLSDLRRLSRYTLDERSEQIITLKDADGIEAVLTLYSVLTNRLEFTMEVDGETKVMTRDELMSYAFLPRAALRKRAYRTLYRVYRDEVTPFSQIYAARVRDWHNEQVSLRGHASPIAARNTANDIPDKAVEVLLESAREHRRLFQRFFRLKAGWLGVEKLQRYDLYAPLSDAERRIPYGEGVRLVLDTFASFHPTFAAQASRVFDHQHIDSEVRKGKRGGAFCATVLPHQTPWVLVNYNGRARDVLTLAHELGHAIHSMLAEHHTLLTQRSSLPLAETASVFAEMLVTDRLLAEESDPAARSVLLLASIDNIYATVMRQAYFVLFEIAAHDAILAGGSPEELAAIYRENLAEQFGDSVDVAPEFQYEWLSIPHFFQTPFYCYSYCFGQLLVLALYRRYQQEGEAFKPGYLEMLAAGGAARPESILDRAGVDMTDPAFWTGGFEVIRDMIDELEASLKQPGAP